jgi:hypothetical protein
MKFFKIFLVVGFYILILDQVVLAQEQYYPDKKIFIFDPNSESISFQSAFSQLSDDSVFVADTIDESINNYDALFLFFGYQFILSQEEGNKLIGFSSENKPVYIFTELGYQSIDSVSFWNHVGVTGFTGLATSVLVDSIVGNNSEFTKSVVIDTSFMSGYIPVVSGNVDSILIGIADGWQVNTAFISESDSFNIIIDLFNLIHNPEFLEPVLIHFGLIDPNSVINDKSDFVNKFQLHQNYPNPFNPTTTIKYSIPIDGFVTLRVFNAIGEEVSILVNEFKSTGNYEILFNTGKLNSGIYFYRLEADNFKLTKKMILMK